MTINEQKFRRGVHNGAVDKVELIVEAIARHAALSAILAARVGICTGGSLILVD
jgi:hypothetical protein